MVCVGSSALLPRWEQTLTGSGGNGARIVIVEELPRGSPDGVATPRLTCEILTSR